MKIDDRAFPLYWPEGMPRTVHRARSAFYGRTLGKARDELLHEIKLLGGREVVLSTNLPLRNDGLFRVDEARAGVDPGIAVYFDLKTQPTVMACDRWSTVACNCRAITLSIAALRGIARWGSTQMVEQAFKGFTALPAPPANGWRSVLGFRSDERPTQAALKAAYERLALEVHPDRGGDHGDMVALNLAITAALEELGS